jgi:colicin import membrane protein
MTIRAVGGGAESIGWTDPTAMVIAQVQQSADEQQQAARQVRRSAQETRAQAAQQEVAEMHRAAELKMWSGIVQGVSTIASAAIDAGRQINRLSAASSTAPQEGGSAAAGLGDRSDEHWETALSTSSRATEGGAQILSSFLSGQAGHAEARARAERERGEAAQARAEDHREDAARAARTAERALEQLSAIVQAQRQAEQAAIRA